MSSKGYVDFVGIEPPTFLDEMVKRVFGIEIRYTGPFPMGEYHGPATLEDGEMTYPKLDADQVLSTLLTVFRADTSRVIMLTDKDMNAQGRPYVFGYGHLSARVGAVSTSRLEPGSEKFPERLTKVVTHELGHTAGLHHCRDECVLHEVANLEELDKRPVGFCPRCMGRVTGEFSLAPDFHENLFELGVALMRRGDQPKAIELMKRAFGLRPDKANYANDLGVAYMKAGLKEDAVRCFRLAQRLDLKLEEPGFNLKLLGEEP